MLGLPMINAIWRVPLILAATGLLASVSVLFSFFDASGRAQHACARIWGRFIFFVSRVRTDVQGLELLEPERGYVFVANHLSMFDHWAFLACLPCQFRFVAKESLFKIPFLGWHLKRAGNIAVSPRHHRATIRAFKAAAERVRAGISYVIYPEGGRTWGEMLPFKKGSFLLPVHANAPIVPVTILAAHNRLPRGSMVIRPGRMSLVVHPPIEPQEFLQYDLQSLARHVQQIVASSYREVD